MTRYLYSLLLSLLLTAGCVAAQEAAQTFDVNKLSLEDPENLILNDDTIHKNLATFIEKADVADLYHLVYRLETRKAKADRACSLASYDWIQHLVLPALGIAHLYVYQEERLRTRLVYMSTKALIVALLVFGGAYDVHLFNNFIADVRKDLARTDTLIEQAKHRLVDLQIKKAT